MTFFNFFFLSFHKYPSTSHVTHLQTVPSDRSVSEGQTMTSSFLLSSLALVSLSRRASSLPGEVAADRWCNCRLTLGSSQWRTQRLRRLRGARTIRAAGSGRKSFTVRQSESRREVPAGYAPSVDQGLPCPVEPFRSCLPDKLITCALVLWGALVCTLTQPWQTYTDISRRKTCVHARQGRRRHSRLDPPLSLWCTQIYTYIYTHPL